MQAVPPDETESPVASASGARKRDGIGSPAYAVCGTPSTERLTREITDRSGIMRLPALIVLPLLLGVVPALGPLPGRRRAPPVRVGRALPAVEAGTAPLLVMLG